MFKKVIFPFLMLSFLLQTINAQSSADAEKAIEDLLSSVKTNAVKTDFKLSSKEKNELVTQNVSGTFTIKGDKFVLDMPVMKAYYDGKTQWSYFTHNNEVSITEPSEKELSETNPMAILSGYKSKCNFSFSDKSKSTQNHCIEMVPKLKKNDIVKIEVQINKTTDNLVSIKLTNKNGGSSLLTLTNYQKDLKTPDNTFVFNSAKYKKVVINDLR
jgi:outer membrane lipoprotein-sorting protein